MDNEVMKRLVKVKIFIGAKQDKFLELAIYPLEDMETTLAKLAEPYRNCVIITHSIDAEMSAIYNRPIFALAASYEKKNGGALELK